MNACYQANRMLHWNVWWRNGECSGKLHKSSNKSYKRELYNQASTSSITKKDLGLFLDCNS